jgi:hypothetical protein
MLIENYHLFVFGHINTYFEPCPQRGALIFRFGGANTFSDQTGPPVRSMWQKLTHIPANFTKNP